MNEYKLPLRSGVGIVLLNNKNKVFDKLDYKPHSTVKNLKELFKII